MNGTVDEQTSERVLRVLTSRTGLAFPPSRRQQARESIYRVMKRGGIESPAEYADALEHDAIDLDPLIEEVTVGETYFFREPAHFAFIRQTILPALGRNGDAALRIWSAACASGEEPYSLAILVEQEGFAESARILGTDISRAALAKAREATYTEWSFRGCDRTLVAKYFDRVGSRFRLQERIRARVVFERLNLALDSYPSIINGTHHCDLILARNVLIYLDRDTIREVARRLFASLRDGGWLIVGPSDPLLSPFAPFETIVADEGVFYRRRDIHVASVSVPPPREEPKVSSPPRVAEPRRSTREARRQPSAEEAFERGDYRRAIELTRDALSDPSTAALYLRAVANGGTAEEAVRAAEELAKRHPVVVELQLLRAVLLIANGRDEEALAVLRRVLYLDRSLAIAHFLIGGILQRSGKVTDALRSYRNAREIAASRPARDEVPLGEGETYGSLLSAVDRHIALVKSAGEAGV